MDLKIDLVRRIACIGNDHGVAVTLVIADTVSRHRTRGGYKRCVPSNAANRCEVDLVGGVGETNNGVEIARPWQRIIKRFEQEGILASRASKQICSSAANDSVIAITPTEIIGKA